VAHISRVNCAMAGDRSR